MQDKLLVAVPNVVYADVEGGHVFLIHSILVNDSDSELDKVWSLVGETSPIEDYTKTDEMFLYAHARIRKWKL